jgi:hypothetical protein
MGGWVRPGRPGPNVYKENLDIKNRINKIKEAGRAGVALIRIKDVRWGPG